MPRFLSILITAFALSAHSQTAITDLSLAADQFAAAEEKIQGSPDFADSRERLARQALTLAQSKPAHPDTAKVLRWILSSPHASPTATKAAKLLLEHHGNSKATVLWLFGQSPREWTPNLFAMLRERELPPDLKPILEVAIALHDRKLLELSDQIQSGATGHEHRLGTALVQKLRDLNTADFESRLIAKFQHIAEQYPHRTFGGAKGRELASGAIFAICHLRLGKQATGLSGKALSGKTIDLSDYRERAILVDFWATWCAPCVAELPRLKQLKQRFANQPFEVIGVNADHSRKTAERFIRKHNLTWPIIRDPQAALQTRWSILSLPTYVVLDHDHRVRYRGGNLGAAANALSLLFGDTDGVDVLVRLTLQQFDRDGDRRISREELPVDKQSVLTAADTDADGTLSLPELTTYIRANLTTRTVKPKP